MKLNLLLIVSNFPSSINNVSGNFYKRITTELVKRGINVTVIAPTYYLNVENIEETTFRVYRPFYFPFPSKFSHKIKAYFLYLSILYEIRRRNIQFDLIDSRYAFPWCFIGVKIAKKFKKPIVSTFIGDDINTDIFNSKFIFDTVSYVIANSRVLTVSNELGQIVKNNFKSNPISVIYDGIAFENLTFTERKKFNEENISIGFVGELTYAKGCDVLLDMIKKLGDNYKWIIIGKGPYQVEFSKYKNVFLKGQLSPEETLNYYSHMDIFLFPSKREGIPNVLKEAAFFKVPIIASDIAGIREMSDNGQLAYLVSKFNDSNEFIKALNIFFANKQLFWNNADNLKDYIVSKFNISKNIDNLISVYINEIQKTQ